MEAERNAATWYQSPHLVPVTAPATDVTPLLRMNQSSASHHQVKVNWCLFHFCFSCDMEKYNCASSRFRENYMSNNIFILGNFS